jgi:hypothetical protein
LAATVHILLTHNKEKKRGMMIIHISVTPTKMEAVKCRVKPYDSGFTGKEGP